jgi:hypothetical protein
MSVSYRIQASPYTQQGKAFVMADYSHPETPMFEFGMVDGQITSQSAEVPDGRIVVCHPDDEQRLRDAPRHAIGPSGVLAKISRMSYHSANTASG